MKRALLLLCLVALGFVACGAPATTPAVTPTASISPAGSPTAAAATAAPSPSPTPPSDPAVDYARGARAHIVALSAIGPRVAGTSSERRAAEYIAATFRAAGYEPESQPFTATGWDSRQVNSANVMAVKAGTSPREIVVGAHYDSSSRSPGADDNASGVAVMLELAELLASDTTPYTIRFIAFGAEEVGLLGSGAYVAQMSQADRANTAVMVNLDSLTAGDFQYVYSDEGARAAPRDWALAWASANGFELQTIRDVDLNDPEGGGCSDYYAFQLARIPFVYFEATNWNLGEEDGYTQVASQYGEKGIIRHTRFDTLAYLDATFPGRVDSRLELVVAVLRALLTEYE